MAVANLRKEFVIFDPNKDKKSINEKVMNIKEDHNEPSLAPIYSMLSDAVKNNSKVYKIEKPIKNNKKIPKFMFL